MKFTPTALKNNNGLAILETLPILMVFLVLFGYGIGFFTVVHTNILNGMAARTYAFETFRNRSSLELFREEVEPQAKIYYGKVGTRVHSISSENTPSNYQGTSLATKRPISFGLGTKAIRSTENDHNTKIYENLRNSRSTVTASPAWVMQGYGICLNAGCGD